MSVGADWLVPEWRVAHVGALMTTRRGGRSVAPYDAMNVGIAVGDSAEAVAANRAAFAEAVGARPVFMRQVHGTRVVHVGLDDARADAATHDADASITTAPGIACVVQAADCLPVLLAAPNGRAVGAAHAGWRGLAGGVVEATVNALCAAAGCEPRELDAWLGACIGPSAFEVGADVLAAFGAEPVASTMEPGRRFVAHAPGKWLADLAGLARDRLVAAGVERIGGGRWCTVTDRSRFFSFRRDGVTGRMAAAVWIERG